MNVSRKCSFVVSKLHRIVLFSRTPSWVIRDFSSNKDKDMYVYSLWNVEQHDQLYRSYVLWQERHTNHCEHYDKSSKPEFLANNSNISSESKFVFSYCFARIVVRFCIITIRCDV